MLLRRALVLLVCFALFFSASTAVADKSSARAAAEKLAKAFLDADYVTFANMTYPKLVAMMAEQGGLPAFLTNELAKMKEQGIEFHNFEILSVSDAVVAGNEQHVVAETMVTMKVPEGYLKQKGFLLGISGDGGKTYSFIDGSNLNPQMIKQLLPNFNDSLTLPTQQQPVLVDTP